MCNTLNSNNESLTRVAITGGAATSIIFVPLPQVSFLSRCHKYHFCPAATSIIFVPLPQVSFLSRCHKYHFCRDKIFVTSFVVTKVCSFVATQIFCRDNHNFLATKTYHFCRGKHTFVRDVFCRDKMKLVATPANNKFPPMICGWVGGRVWMRGCAGGWL